MTLLYDHCKAKPNVTQLPKLVAFAQAAEAAGDIPPLSNLADDSVFLYRGTVDEIYKDGCVNATAGLFEALGVPSAHVYLNAAVPSAHCWPTADVAVPPSSCGQQNSPGAPPAMENCGFDGAGAALQYLFNNSLTAPTNVSAFDPNNLLMCPYAAVRLPCVLSVSDPSCAPSPASLEPFSFPSLPVPLFFP
jgi:hypothetical protein